MSALPDLGINGRWQYGLPGSARLLAEARDGVVTLHRDALAWAAANGCQRAALALAEAPA